MRISVEPVPNSRELRFNPSVNDMYNVVSRCFDKIIAVASNVPTIETVLFPELPQSSYLFPLFRSETAVSKKNLQFQHAGSSEFY